MQISAKDEAGREMSWQTAMLLHGTMFSEQLVCHHLHGPSHVVLESDKMHVRTST